MVSHGGFTTHFLMTDEDMVLQAEGITFVKTPKEKKVAFWKIPIHDLRGPTDINIISISSYMFPDAPLSL